MPNSRALVVFLLICLSTTVLAVELSLQATVTVNPPPLNLDVDVSVLTPKVKAGDDLNFLVELSKVPGDEITVGLLYEVVKTKGKGEEIVLSANDSMQLSDSNSIQKSLLIPSKTKAGYYALRVTATYFNQSDSDEGEFRVVSRNKGKGKNLGVVGPPNLLLKMFTDIINLFI